MRSVTRMLLGTVLASAVAITAVAAQDQGAEKFVLDGGSRGSVSFPHRLHQDNLGDCQACHDAFPMKQGVIVELKAEGKLKKKQVMNSKCVDCHKKYKADGKKFGPVKCGECHTR